MLQRHSTVFNVDHNGTWCKLMTFLKQQFCASKLPEKLCLLDQRLWELDFDQNSAYHNNQLCFTTSQLPLLESQSLTYKTNLVIKHSSAETWQHSYLFIEYRQHRYLFIEYNVKVHSYNGELRVIYTNIALSRTGSLLVSLHESHVRWQIEIMFFSLQIDYAFHDTMWCRWPSFMYSKERQLSTTTTSLILK